MKKLIAIVGAVVVILGGVLALWLLWWQPEQDREKVTDQITAWEKKWDVARACLLGPHPLAADASDALALAELGTGSKGAKTCTDPIGAIVRDPGEMLPDEIERAFGEVEAAIPALANAYAMRLSDDGDDVDARVAKLGVAISALDGADDRLREIAGMAPRARAAQGPPITRLDPQPLDLARGIPRAGTIDEGDAIATGPGQVKRLAGAGVVDVPGGTWMVAPLPARVFDTHGAPAASVLGWMPAAATVDFAGATEVAGDVGIAFTAVGDGPDRGIVVEPQEGSSSFTLLVSHDGGKTFAKGQTITDDSQGELHGHASMIDGIIDLYFEHVDVLEENWYQVDPATLTVGQEVPASDLDLRKTCRRGAGITWWIDGTGDLRTRTVGGQVASLHLPDERDLYDLEDCTANAALVVHGTSPIEILRCTTKECTTALHGASYAFGRSAMLDDGSAVYLALRGTIAALWTEGAADARYYKLPRPMTNAGVVVWGGVPYAVLDDGGKRFTAALK